MQRINYSLLLILESKRDFYQQKVADVYEYYERELRKNNALDFDDLILVAVKLLQSNEAVLDKYSKRFRYVMIDSIKIRTMLNIYWLNYWLHIGKTSP